MQMSPPLPCLAMVHGVGAQHQPPTAATLFSIADARPLAGPGTASLVLEEELRSKSFCPTPQGWILVHDRDASPGAATTYLLDPHSLERVDLPHLAIEQRLIPYCRCLLLPGANPTAPGSPVLLVEPIDTVVWYCRVGDSAGGEWTRHEYDIGTVGDEHFVEKRAIAPIAACRGRFYFNPVPTETRVLELFLRPGAATLAPEFGLVATDPTEDLRFGTAKGFMVGTDDGEEEELFKVMLVYGGGSYDEAKVFRMDFSESGWRPVRDLGGRAFFVAPMYFCASWVPVARSGIRPDCVYSLGGAANNSSFRVFNVKDGTSEVCSIEEQQPTMPETVGKSRPCWVLPTHSRA